MLKCIKQYNKEAREVKAKKEGFNSASEMISYLEGLVSKGKGGTSYNTPTIKTPSGRHSGIDSKPSSKSKTPASTKAPAKVTSSRDLPTIHVVDILDASGSMSGLKIKNAIIGINKGITALKVDTAKVKYTYSLTDFSDNFIFKYVTVPLSGVSEFNTTSRGSTALFDAIGKTVEKVKSSVKKDHKVLVNIYTDGQENSSREFNATAINTLIKSLSEQGWTFTFIGTKSDVEYAQSMLSIHDSNTLVYDGTGAGLEKSLNKTVQSRSMYSAKVSAGEDVSKGFYKDIN